MSYGIVRVQKMTAGAVKGIEIHDKRKKDVSHTNKDIDWTKTNLNYDLHHAQNQSFTKPIKEKIQALELTRAVRKDAIVMAQLLVTSDHEFFENLSNAKQTEFFTDSYNFLADKYGGKNIISATVHLDEKTPHMHLNFVPITDDGRLSAKSIFRHKSDLSKLHDHFFKSVGQKYGLERGLEGGTKRHLEVAELKKQTAYKELEALKSQQEKLQDSLQALTSEVKGRTLSIHEVERIKPTKSVTGALKGISIDEVEQLKATAIKGLEAQYQLEKLIPEWLQLKRLVPTLAERTTMARDEGRLAKLEKAFKNLPADQQRELLVEPKAKTQRRDYTHER